MALARLLEGAHTHSTLSTLAYEVGFEDDAVGQNKLARCLGLVRAMEKRFLATEDDQPLAELIQRTLGELTDWQTKQESAVGLVAALAVDGFEYENGRLIPTTVAPAALAPEVSALERRLQQMGWSVAATHYSQAADSLTRGSLEAANGQVRSCLENLFISACESAHGRHFSDAGASLQHLRHAGTLEPGEWNMFRGFWDVCQTNGPHHGLTTDEEALFRLHAATALARYLLHKLAGGAAQREDAADEGAVSHE